MRQYTASPTKIAHNAPHVRMMLAYMHRHGKNQKELADILQVDHSTLGRWLDGKFKITRKNMAIIQAVCGSVTQPPNAGIVPAADRLNRIWPELTPVEMTVFESVLDVAYEAHKRDR